MRKCCLFCIILSLSFYFIGINDSFACGTIEGWVEIYFDKNHDEQDQALYWIQCQPVVVEQYKNTKKQQELLIKMINQGLDDPRLCYKYFAVKSFFIFDKLSKMKDTKDYSLVSSKIEKLLGRLIKDIKTTKRDWSYFDWQNQDEYCKIVEGEVNRISNR